jgi:hypothetical protein
VTVDDRVYRVESLAETPIVCSLRPGPHVVRMSRTGAALYEEHFVLEARQEIVLCAYERADVPHAGIDRDPRVAAGDIRGPLSIRPRR